MAIAANKVKELREQTGAGIMECKSALEEAQGDMEKAMAILRERGQAKAAKRSGRETLEGLIDSYIHIGGKIGVLVEVDCETDFVARNAEFKQLVKDIAMQIAATDPKFVSKEDVSDEILAQERKLYHQEAVASGAAEGMIPTIIEGKIAKFYTDKCLYEQPFIKDASTTIGELIRAKIAKIGENIKVNRFVRFKIGEPS
jgi:elongation factor Ts